MGFWQKIGRPGESINLLAFIDDFRSFKLTKGWTKYGKYLDNSKFMEGAELNESKPIIQKNDKDKKIGLYYPVDLDKGQGIQFIDHNDSDKMIGQYIQEEKFRKQDGILIPDPNGQITREVLTEVYPGLPVEVKGKKSTVFMRRVLFDLDPIRVKIFTNPKLVGHSVASEIFANSLRMKPMRWQLIIAAVIAFVIGYVAKGG